MQHATDTRLATIVAAFASLGAGLIHIAVIPGHWQEWLPSGLFFAGIALFQLAWSGLVLRFPRRVVISLGIAANVGSMAMWGVSRIWGIPVGPNAGVPEPIGTAGVLAISLEALLVISAVWSVVPRERIVALSAGSYRFALSAAALVVVAMMAPGVAAGLDHGHSGGEHGHGGDNSGSHQEPTTGPVAPPADGEPDPAGPQPSESPSPAPEGDTHDDGHTHG